MTERLALISVTDKTGLAHFAKELVALGFRIISTGGTRRHIQENGIPVTDISVHTGFPEIMDGRVKTLHPKVHGGLLGRPDLPGDAAVMKEHGIPPFELVVCNLYEFEKKVAAGGTFAEVVEEIDIGGPSMIRSSAKNHAYVGVVTRPTQYAAVLEALKQGPLSAELKRELAAAAFEMTAQYERAIADYMKSQVVGWGQAEQFPPRLSLRFELRESLRYGENPHQQAALYVEAKPHPSTLAAAQMLHGKEPSYNNLLDLDAALNLVREYYSPAAVVIKHNNPCGAAMDETLLDAWVRAYAGDPVSAFGSVLGFNQPVDIAVAEQLCLPDRFVECIIAPDFTPDAFAALTTRPKWKASVRLLKCPGINEPPPPMLDYRRVSGGLLVQTCDVGIAPEADWKCVTTRQPTDAEMRDLRFALPVAKYTKSNAIVFAKNCSVLGVGAGQMSRVDSVMIASKKSEGRSQGAVLAGDAFFPFRDGVDLAAKAGIRAIIQPGGSKKDDEAIAACNENDIAMIFTGRRHFRH
jgi:phosphoribosylaminoimidazolecarboxamide formyltransferase/IMP cyclohydrolase